MTEIDKTEEKRLSRDLVAQFLENQGREISVREKELEVQGQDLANQHRVAEKSIDAQASDRQQERETEERTHLRNLVFSGIMVLLALCAIGLSVYSTNKDIALKVLEWGLAATAGYFAGKSGKT